VWYTFQVYSIKTHIFLTMLKHQ